jgi:hypothetical protein
MDEIVTVLEGLATIAFCLMVLFGFGIVVAYLIVSAVLAITG